MNVIDLSKPIQYNAGDPSFMKVKIKHKSHGRARWLIRLLGLPFRFMPKDFAGWAYSWRRTPRKLWGKPARTLAAIPNRVYGPSVYDCWQATGRSNRWLSRGRAARKNWRLRPRDP